MPGVYRPSTLADVINVLNGGNDSSGAGQGSSVTGLSYFTEVDEAMPLADTVTASAQANATWNSATWGAFGWS